MRDFPITFLFLISRESELEVVAKNHQMLEGVSFDYNIVNVYDESKSLTKRPVLTGQTFKGFFKGDFADYKNRILGVSNFDWLPYIYICDGDEVIPWEMFPGLFKIMDANHSVNDNEAIAFPRMNSISWEEDSSSHSKPFAEEQFELIGNDHLNNPNSHNSVFSKRVSKIGITANGLLYPDYQLRLFNKQALKGFEGKLHEQPVTKNHYRYAVNLGDIQHDKTLDERIIANTLYHNITHEEVAV